MRLQVYMMNPPVVLLLKSDAVLHCRRPRPKTSDRGLTVVEERTRRILAPMNPGGYRPMPCLWCIQCNAQSGGKVWIPVSVFFEGKAIFLWKQTPNALWIRCHRVTHQIQPNVAITPPEIIMEVSPRKGPCHPRSPKSSKRGDMCP